MDSVKNDKTEKEVEEKISALAKKNIEELLLNREGNTSPVGSEDKQGEALSGAGIEPQKTLNDKNTASNRRSDRSSLEDRMSMMSSKTTERKANEKFQRKLSKINRQSVKDIKKNIKEKSRKIAERKKIAFKKKLKEKMKKKLTMNAKEGKSITMSLLFIIFLFIALLNDSVDIVVGIVSWAVTLTGVGAIVLAATEVIGDIIDIITTVLLVGFSFYIGGTTKAGAKRFVKRAILYLGAFAIELVPLLNLFATWLVVLLYDWYKVRKRATEAEKMDEKINQISGR
jgi:hypothetical protein